MNTSVRPAAVADIAGLAAIERAADALFPPGRIPQGDDGYPVAAFRRAIDEGVLLVADSATGVVGFAVAEYRAPWLHLFALAVHPDHGRQGIGRALVEGVLVEAQKRGSAGVSLTTFADVPFNGPFYERLGFVPLREGELTPFLAETLRGERSRGLTRRQAMAYYLAA